MRKVKVGSNNAAWLSPTMFSVAPAYVITKKDTVEASPEFLGSPDGWRRYSPRETSCIYSHLATVKDRKTLLRFVSRFGLLGIQKRKDTPVHLAGIAPGHTSAASDHVGDILQVAADMSNILNAYSALEKGRIVERRFIESYIVGEDCLWPEWWDVLGNADSLALTRAYLALRVSAKLGGVRPAANFTAAGDVVPGYAYLSLHDAVWHQLYMDMTKQASFKECPFCGSWHTGAGIYCPAPPFYNRSPCENAYNQKLYRKRKKQKNREG